MKLLFVNTISPKRPVTSKDIARAAKVSQATVSRVLAGHPGVQAETRDRVLAAVRSMNYHRNAMARAIRTNRNGNIGVVVSRLSNPVYPEILQILGATLRAADLRMMVWSTDEGDEAAAASALQESLVDGVVMTTATATSLPLYEAVMRKAPVVLVHRVMQGWPCDQVTSDNAGGARAVADHLVEGGRQRIGLIAGPTQASTIRDRLNGFRSRLAVLGRPLNPALCVEVDSFSHKAGVEAAQHLLDLAHPPDALFCVNDVLALGASDAARTRGVAVPDDLWIVGYDDIEMCSWPAFDLTTVRQPFEAMVRRAVGFLQARIAGSTDEHQLYHFPNDLVVRGSTSGYRAGRKPTRAIRTHKSQK